jgi:hypothetical protein
MVEMHVFELREKQLSPWQSALSAENDFLRYRILCDFL